MASVHALSLSGGKALTMAMGQTPAGPTCFVEHDLAQQHVLEHRHGLAVIQRTELLKGLKEVAVGCLVVLLLSMQDATLGVNLHS